MTIELLELRVVRVVEEDEIMVRQDELHGESYWLRHSERGLYGPFYIGMNETVNHLIEPPLITDYDDD